MKETRDSLGGKMQLLRRTPCRMPLPVTVGVLARAAGTHTVVQRS